MPCSVNGQELWLTVRKRVKLRLSCGSVNSAETCQGVLSVDVHGARSANSLSARPSEGQCRVHLVLNLDDGIKNHRSALVEVDGVALKVRLLAGLVRVLRGRGYDVDRQVKLATGSG